MMPSAPAQVGRVLSVGTLSAAATVRTPPSITAAKYIDITSSLLSWPYQANAPSRPRVSGRADIRALETPAPSRSASAAAAAAAAARIRDAPAVRTHPF